MASKPHSRALPFLGFFLISASLYGQSEPVQTPASTSQRQNASTTSNTTAGNDTRRAVQLDAVRVVGPETKIGAGLMSVQTAPKAVSTVTRSAIDQAAPGSNFAQLITSIPGVKASTDDVTGLSNGNYTLRGFDSTELGVTVNGVPITDPGNYQTYATQYGDSENINDITVIQGIPDVDMPDSGSAGGHIAWSTIDPSHQAGLDATQTFGSYDYRRTFLRLNTGDIGPVRSWLSYSDNSANKWRGNGDMKVTKVDGKSVWTIDGDNSISASLEYNRERNDRYLNPTKQMVEKYGYSVDYNRSYVPNGSPSTNVNYYGLYTSPFVNRIVSLDGEFTLNDSLHLSVIPYFQYGTGGSGSGNANFIEFPVGVNAFGAANQDLNGDGKVTLGARGVTYAYAYSNTYRPGVTIKFNEELGLNNNLEYGVWYERSRQQQGQSFGLVNNQTGDPAAIWGDSGLVVYAKSNQPQEAFLEDTTTEIKKGFVTDTWTPSDQWTVTGGLAYIYANRSGYGIEYPGAQVGQPNPKYNPADTSNPCNTPLAAVQCGGVADVNFHKVTPTAGVKFQLDDYSQFFYGIGKSFRVPPNNAVYLNNSAGKAPNAPETAWNNDLGWRFYDDAVSASVMIYRSNFNNKTENGYDQATGLQYYVSIPRMRLQGVNAEANYAIAPHWSLYGSYTYTEATIKSDLDAGGNGIYPTSGKQLSNTPRNMGYVQFGYDDGKQWANVSAQYHSSMYGDYMHTEQVGGYTSFSLNAGYNFRSVGWLKKPYIKVNLANLTDHKAYTNASLDLLADKGAKGANGAALYATSPTYSLLEPRTVMVTLGISLF